ncbi:MAG: hypothetical protein WC807_01715 [Hyphomicrobium sp.]|jgi:hypothetical protein
MTSLNSIVERLMTGEADNEKQRLRRQRLRSIAIALALGFMVALFYAATIVRLGGNVMNRPL